jgi:hypothetical protein
MLTDADRHRAIAEAASRRVHELFCEERVVPMYVSLYSDVLTG